MVKTRCCRWALPSPHLIWWRWCHYPTVQRWSGTSLPLYTLAQTSFYSENKAKGSRKQKQIISLLCWTSYFRRSVKCCQIVIKTGYKNCPYPGSVNVCNIQAFLCKCDLTVLRFRLAALLRCREMTTFVSCSKYLWRWLDFTSCQPIWVTLEAKESQRRAENLQSGH